jgi:hypothetical protein
LGRGGGATSLTITPDRFLLIVSRRNEELANYLQQHFKGDGTVQVVVDRRHGDQRQGPREQSPRPADPSTERRRSERRTRPDVDKELRLTSFAIVTLPPDSPQTVQLV